MRGHRPYTIPHPVSNPHPAWVLGGIFAAGALVTGGFYFLARRAAAPIQSPGPSPQESGGVPSRVPAVTDASTGPEGPGIMPPSRRPASVVQPVDPTSSGRAPSEAASLWVENRGPIDVATRQWLDAVAEERGIQGGWQTPTLSPDWLAASPAPKPDVGPGKWNRATAWRVATEAMRTAMPSANPYDDLEVWAGTVSPDGPADAWLKGVVMGRVMGLLRLPLEPASETEVDWTIFAPRWSRA